MPTENHQAPSLPTTYDRLAQLAEARIEGRVAAFHRRLRAHTRYLEAHGFKVIAPDPLPREELQTYRLRP